MFISDEPIACHTAKSLPVTVAKLTPHVRGLEPRYPPRQGFTHFYITVEIPAPRRNETAKQHEYLEFTGPSIPHPAGIKPHKNVTDTKGVLRIHCVGVRGSPARSAIRLQTVDRVLRSRKKMFAGVRYFEILVSAGSWAQVPLRVGSVLLRSPPNFSCSNFSFMPSKRGRQTEEPARYPEFLSASVCP